MLMKKRKPKPEFDPKLLDKLAKDEGSCVYVHNLKHHIALHPYHLNNLNASVREILNKGIAKYNPELDGILFGYNNIKFISQLGQIVDDSCFIHVDIEADFYIFKPAIDQTLRGIVNKKSEDHVGCLVHNIFNVSLPKPKHGDDWVGHSLGLNSEVLFTVTQTNFEGKLPYIKGKIESVLSNPGIDDSELDLPRDGKKSKTRKAERAKSKKRKRLDFEDNPESSLKEADEGTDPPKKKRKKSKKSDSSKDDKDLDFSS